MNENFSEITGVQLGLMSPDMIRAYSAAEVKTHLHQNKKIAMSNGINDPRGGTIEKNQLCTTDKESLKGCSGHNMHKTASYPFVNPLFGEEIVRYLSCICFYCSRLKARIDPLFLKHIQNIQDPKDRLYTLARQSKSIAVCGDKCTSSKRHVLVPKKNPKKKQTSRNKKQQNPPPSSPSMCLDEDIETISIGDGMDTDADDEEPASEIEEDDEDEIVEEEEETTTIKSKTKKKTIPTSSSSLSSSSSSSISLKKKIKQLKEFDKKQVQQTILPILLKENVEQQQTCVFTGCRHRQPLFKYSGGTIQTKLYFPFKGTNVKPITECNNNLLLKVLNKIPQEDLLIMGVTGNQHPAHMFITEFIIPPPIIRPATRVDNGKYKGMDDLTTMLKDIIRRDNKLAVILKDGKSFNDNVQYIWEDLPLPMTTLVCKCDEPRCTCLLKHIPSLKMTCKEKEDEEKIMQPPPTTLFHSAKYRKNHSKTELIKEIQEGVNSMIDGRTCKKDKTPIHSLRMRIIGKGGRIRGNSAGKRVDFSARTVVSPETEENINTVRIPAVFARVLTYPEKVTERNYTHIVKLIKQRKVNYIQSANGELYYLKDFNVDELVLDEDKPTLSLKKILQVGSIAERHLQNGDIVIVGRQPSLHAPSMMALIVEIAASHEKIIRINISITDPFNADYDGDQMNLHVPQSEESRAEAFELLFAPHYIVSGQSSRPIISNKFNGLIGAYYMTDKTTFLTREQMMQLASRFKNKYSVKEEEEIFRVNQPGIWQDLKPAHSNGKLYSGVQCFDLFYPKDFNFKNQSTQYVVQQGITQSGQVTAKEYGNKMNGIIHKMYLQYGPSITVQYISGMQRVLNDFLLSYGSTISPKDVRSTKETYDKIQKLTSSVLEYNDKYLSSTNNVNNEEAEGTSIMLMDKVKMIAIDEIKKDFSTSTPQNSMVDFEKCGAKVQPIHMVQLASMLGQQKLFGKRVPHCCSTFNDQRNSAKAKGMITNSFTQGQGLQIDEFFYHALGGREGLVDTAQKTQETGHMSRQLSKQLENLIIRYDGSVTSSNQDVYQFISDEDGFDPKYMSQIHLPWINPQYNIETDIGPLDWCNHVQTTHWTNDTKKRWAQQLLDTRILHEMNTWHNSCLETYKFLIKTWVQVIRCIVQPPLYSVVPYSSLELTSSSSSSSVQTDITPWEYMKQYLWVLQFKHYKPNTVQLGFLISYLSPFKVFSQPITSYRVQQVLGLFKDEQLSPKYQNIDYLYSKYKSVPGFCVGIASGQYIGEPTMQSTLKTFHFAGTGQSAKLVQGIPRMKKLLGGREDPSNASMQFFLHPHIEFLDAYRFSQYIVTQNLDYYTTQSYVSNWQDFRNMEWLKEEHNGQIWAPFIPSVQEESNWYNYVLHFDLDIEKQFCVNLSAHDFLIAFQLYTYRLTKTTIHNIEQAVRVFFDIHPISKSIVSAHVILSSSLALIMNIKSKKDEQISSLLPKEGVELHFAQELANRMTKDCIIHGIPNITGSELLNHGKKVNRFQIDPTTNMPKPSQQYHVLTLGSNMDQVCTYSNLIELESFYSNDLHDVYKTLGIECARIFIDDEIDNTLLESSANVNRRSIKLLADSMTRFEDFRAANRHCIPLQDDSTFRRLGFESPLEHVKTSAQFGKHDPLLGISERLLFNKPGNYGTKAMDIIFDKEKTTSPSLSIATSLEWIWQYVNIPVHQMAYGDYHAFLDTTEGAKPEPSAHPMLFLSHFL